MAFSAERMLAFVDKTGPGKCWLWTGAQTSNGYGKYSGTVAHRAVYRTLVGPIAEGLQLDHLCGVLLCVNPDHLDPVDQFENMRRRFATYTNCAVGHELTAENTYMRPNGRRDCRACIRDRVRRYKDGRRAARVGAA